MKYAWIPQAGERNNTRKSLNKNSNASDTKRRHHCVVAQMELKSKQALDSNCCDSNERSNTQKCRHNVVK